MAEPKVIESRSITKEEYDLIIGLIDKYKLDGKNFINNSKTLVLNKIDFDGIIYNGYDASNNIINYNEKSNLVRELLHVASSTRSIYQGICVKPNRVYVESMGTGFNEGITDMFLELCNKEEGPFPFEKICAKTFQYVHTVKMFNLYFGNNDGGLRRFFSKDVTKFLMELDDYSSRMIYYQRLLKNGIRIPESTKLYMKLTMTIIIDDVFELLEGSNKDYKSYLFKLLKSKTMKPVYDMLGEYDYDKYHK